MNILYADGQPICRIEDADTCNTEIFDRNNESGYGLKDATCPVQSEISNIEHQIEMLNIQSNIEAQNQFILNSINTGFNSIYHDFNVTNAFVPIKRKNSDTESITISLKKCSTLGESMTQLLFVLKKILPKITPSNIDEWGLKINIDPSKTKEKKKK